MKSDALVSSPHIYSGICIICLRECRAISPAHKSWNSKLHFNLKINIKYSRAMLLVHSLSHLCRKSFLLFLLNFQMQLTRHEQLIHPLHLLMLHCALVIPFLEREEKKNKTLSRLVLLVLHSLEFFFHFIAYTFSLYVAATKCISFIRSRVRAHKKKRGREKNTSTCGCLRKATFLQSTVTCTLAKSFLCANKYCSNETTDTFDACSKCLLILPSFDPVDRVWELKVVLILVNCSVLRVVIVVEKTKVSHDSFVHLSVMWRVEKLRLKKPR